MIKGRWLCDRWQWLPDEPWELLRSIDLNAEPCECTGCVRERWEIAVAPVRMFQRGQM